MGYPLALGSSEKVQKVINSAQLSGLISNLPDGLDTYIGENGSKLSGGQRQRIGIARALFTSPKLLVLDEATSALDGQTEAELSDAIQALKGQVTVVLIAHRLSTVQKADQIIYLDNGKLIAKGTFDEIRARVPSFEKQASLMGL
jgi:ABC-type multidrug transport system fused ATPase/permease subunit